MSKTYEVMTRSLATCAPDARVTDVATIMRDRNIGAVLVVADGELRGIVTDRDLAIQALSGKDDALQAPIHKYMSAPVVTGEPEWSLEKVSDVMAKHQIRRLPIVQDGQLAGIVSLGDVALHVGKKQVVADSLQAISEPVGPSFLDRVGRGRVLTAFAVAASATTIFALLALNHSRPGLRKQMAKSAMYHGARHAVRAARAKVDEATPRETARELRDQVLAKLNELSAQLTALQAKPKQRRFWSA